MTSWPRISIVTPSFQQASFLNQTMESVLSQGYPNLEYIVIDGGSTDGSVEIIKRYEKRLGFWCSEKDNGQYEAINKGLSKCSGDIYGWLNSDDIYFPWTLFSVAKMMSDVPEIDWISSLMPGVIHINGLLFRLNQIPGFSRHAFLEGKYLPPGNAAFGYIQQESTFWRRGLWEKCGGLRPAHHLAGDFDLWSRFFQHAELWGCPIPLAAFRRHFQQRSADQAAYNGDALHSLRAMRLATRWSKSFWRDSAEKLRLRKIPLVSRIVNRLCRFTGHKLVLENPEFPDPKWAPVEYEF